MKLSLFSFSFSLFFALSAFLFAAPMEMDTSSKENKILPSLQSTQRGRRSTDASKDTTSAEQARNSFTGLKEGAQQQPTTPLTRAGLAGDDDSENLVTPPRKPNVPNMDAASSLSRTAIEAAISSASSFSSEQKDPPRTPGVTEVHHLGNIQASIRTRPQLVPSFADLNARDQLTFAEIEKKEAAQIAVITQKANHDKAIARASSGGMATTAATLGITEQARNAIAEVQKSAAAQKQALFAKVKPVLVATDLSRTETELHSVFDQFSQKLTAIENEQSARIQSAENKANAAQALAMRRGMGMAVGYRIEEDKTKAITDIKKTTDHQRNILFLQAKQELLEHQQSYFESFFKTEIPQIRSNAGTAPTLERREQCQKIINQSFEAEEKIFTSLGNLEQTDEPTIAAAIKTVALADAVRMRALHPFVEHSINTSLDQVDETSALLHTLSQSKNKFLNTKALSALHEELDQRHANYLSAEPLFNEEAREIAVDNTSYLGSKIKELNLELKRTSSEKNNAAGSDQIFLEQKVNLLTNLSTALESAQQAYAQIADVSSIKIKIPTTSINESIEFPATSDQTSLPALNEASESLSNLAAQTTIPSRTAGLNFLSKLSDFAETENDQAIFGRRGEIELIDGSALPFVPNAKLAQEGINVVRLAVFRDFGAQGLQRFDAHFHDKMVALESPEAQNFLTLGELKEFIQTEDQINPSAFYLSSAHSIAELIFAESDPVEESKFVKIDGTSFHPFSKTTPIEATLHEDQEPAEGLVATRAALKEFFKDLPAELRQSILNRFDDKFKTAKTPLTVEKLRSFIKAEIENLKSSNLDVTGPFFYSLSWQLGVTSFWTFMMSAHPPAWVMMPMILSINVGHDMTAYWRQLRPEDEK